VILGLGFLWFLVFGFVILTFSFYFWLLFGLLTLAILSYDPTSPYPLYFTYALSQ